MKRITGISLVVWAVWGAVCGCKDTDGQDEEKEQAMEGAVQKLNENYVDTMMLHKVVFNKQIKCNGKLGGGQKRTGHAGYRTVACHSCEERLFGEEGGVAGFGGRP